MSLRWLQTLIMDGLREHLVNEAGGMEIWLVVGRTVVGRSAKAVRHTSTSRRVMMVEMTYKSIFKSQ